MLEDHKDRITKLLANPKVDASTESFLFSLLHNVERWGKLTERQEKALKRIEDRHTDEAIIRRERWTDEWNEEKRQVATICASYYLSTGAYFFDLATRVLNESDFVPSEKQFNAMCCNKYAKKVIENTQGEAKYLVGSFVDFRSGAPRAALHLTPEAINTPALVLETGVGVVTTHAKGGKKYKVLPVGSVSPITIEERHLKKSRKAKSS